ncbi:MAG TPA: hypothetical protein VMF58_17025 [Rhizomicrobium sp.]|nr:hypothetical protein [Rhizomicrobium sp.]
MISWALDIAGCIGIPCVLFYVILRHWIFVVLALWPPILVLTAVVFFGQPNEEQIFTSILFGGVATLSLADEAVRGVCAGFARAKIASSMLRVAVSAIVPLLFAYLLTLCADIFISRDWFASKSLAAQFTFGFAAALTGAWLCAHVPFSEQFIARANAARERRERLLEAYFPEMPSRWALSVTGIAIVLATVALFGIRDAHIRWTVPAALSLSVGAAFMLAGFAVLARDWRMASALTLANLFVGVLLCWVNARLYPHPKSFSLTAMLVLSSVPLGLIAARARIYLSEGAEMVLALASAVRDEGAIAIFLGVAVGVPAVFGALIFLALSPAFVFAIASAFAALLLFPALTIAIHTILPRYRTVDEVFGKR